GPIARDQPLEERRWIEKDARTRRAIRDDGPPRREGRRACAQLGAAGMAVRTDDGAGDGARIRRGLVRGCPLGGGGAPRGVIRKSANLLDEVAHRFDERLCRTGAWTRRTAQRPGASVPRSGDSADRPPSPSSDRS